MGWIGELNWDLIRTYGYDDTYYHIDQWLTAEGIDGFACSLLPERWGCPTFSRMNMWRTFFVMSLNEWNQTETAQRVADSLSLRVFIRRPALEEVTPAQQHLSVYQQRFIDLVNQGLVAAATIWSQSGFHHDQRGPRPRRFNDTSEWEYRARRMLDGWCVRVKSGPLPLPTVGDPDH